MSSLGCRESYSGGRVSLKAFTVKLPEMLGEAARCGALLAAMHRRNWLLEKPAVPLQLAAGKVARTAGA